MLVSEFFVYFIIYSFLGWIYESCYCTINEHSWQNRGFLYGPIVPMYGLAAVACHIVFIRLPFESLHNVPWWGLFLICAAGSFVMEYVTSYGLEKLFHARWWDYSNIPLNINGRVALPFTCCFGIAGVVIISYLLPWVNNLHSVCHPLVFEILALIFMLIFGMDLALTVSALTNFSKEFERINNEINTSMENKYIALEQSVIETKEAIAERKEAMAEKKELTSEKWAEIKEQMSVEAIKDFISRAPETQRGQLRHITKFSHPVTSTKSLMEKASNTLKKRKNK